MDNEVLGWLEEAAALEPQPKAKAKKADPALSAALQSASTPLALSKRRIPGSQTLTPSKKSSIGVLSPRFPCSRSFALSKARMGAINTHLDRAKHRGADLLPLCQRVAGLSCKISQERVRAHRVTTGNRFKQRHHIALLNIA